MNYLRLQEGKRKAKKLIRIETAKGMFEDFSGNIFESAKEKGDHLLRSTRVPCSCEMCRNPRRAKLKQKDKLTLQERRHNEVMKMELAS